MSIRVGQLEPLVGGIRPAPPGRIRIPAADVDAGIEPVQAHRDGLEVPPTGLGRLVLRRRAARRARAAVVVGHFDMEEGPGVFEGVPSLDRGARIDVTDNRGAVHTYRVVGVTRVRKRRFPTEAVYGPSSHPVLVLVTCGGPFKKGRGYRDNVLVYARSA